MGRVIEFIGAPASGKSTIARELVARFQDAGVAAHLLEENQWPTLIARQLRSLSPMRRWLARLNASRVMHALRYPRLHCWALALALSVRPDRRHALWRMYRLLGWTRRARLMTLVPDDTLLVAEEGPFNWLVGTALHGERFSRRCLEHVARHVARVPARRLIVADPCDDAVTLERMIARAGLSPGEPMHLWRYEGTDADEARKLVREFQQHMQRLCAVAETVAEPVPLHVRTDVPVERSTETIFEALHEQKSVVCSGG